jgi:prepilin-type N-terminal cleavage/methylation domain-containing protein
MKDRGFSLLEVLVAISILAVGVSAGAQLFLLAASANTRARLTTLASTLAQQKMEELLSAAPAPSPEGSLGTDIPGYYDMLDAGGRAPGSVFTRRWAVESLPEHPGEAFVFQVLVTSDPERATADSGAPGTRSPGQVRLLTVQTRSQDDDPR